MCSFCGLQGIREKAGGPYKFMTTAVAERTAHSIAAAKWNARIEFAMHGEPSMNPDFIELIRIFRSYLPKNQLMMTSNGAGFLKNTVGTIQAAFAAGLNILALDDYKRVNLVPKVREKAGDNFKVVDYPKDGLNLSPHRRWPRSTNIVIIIEDIADAGAGSHAQINNHAGFGAPKSDRLNGKRCAKPFREIGVRWDGKVAGCCVDWTGNYKIGSVMKTPIAELWQTDAFNAMRKKLFHGERDFGPCAGCDHDSYRVGLLPDHLGKEELQKVNVKDKEVIAAALGGASFTKLVKREWMPRGMK
jgi:MoaA/NifB/PqqE/SkfB family radical SAM enzyme